MQNIVRERISSSQAAHTKICQRLQEVVKELAAARKELRRLKSCQHDSLVPTKMIQTRLERRSHRPHNEACTDSPHVRSGEKGGGRRREEEGGREWSFGTHFVTCHTSLPSIK